MNLEHIRREKTRGMSFVEILIVVSAIGTLVSLGITMFGALQDNTKDQKFESDVTTINRALSTFTMFGGNLEVDNFSDALLRLKSQVTNAEIKETVGLSSTLIDVRLEPVMQSAAEAATDMPRAVWDKDSGKLVISDSGPAGIKEFRLNEDLGNTAPLIASRESSFDFGAGWIWKYENDYMPTDQLAPTTVKLTEDTSIVSEPLLASVAAPLAPPPSPPSSLSPPSVLLAGGSYPISQFSLSVPVSNPNPVGSSTITYSIDYGTWTPLLATEIAVGTDQVLRVQAVPVDSTWTASTVVEKQYTAIPEKLLAPAMAASENSFSAAPDNTVSVALNNPTVKLSNQLVSQSSVADLIYRLNGGTWQTYANPFDLKGADWPQGVQVEARSVPSTSKYWMESEIVSTSIGNSPAQWSPSAFDGSIFSKQDITFNSVGDVDLSGGLRAENGMIDINSVDNITMNGDLIARADITASGIGGGTINGDLISETNVSIPSWVTHNGNTNICPIGTMELHELPAPTGPNDPNYAAPITIINGDYVVNGSLNLEGTIYATGSIAINSGSNITGSGALIAEGEVKINSVDSVGLAGGGVFLYSRGSTISLNSIGTVAINGVLYAPSNSGNIIFNSVDNVVANGGIYSGGSLSFNQINSVTVGTGAAFQSAVPPGIEAMINGSQLSPPTITLSEANFPSGSGSVTATLNNPNDAAVSNLQYRLDGGSWQPYSGPLTLLSTDWPAGVQIDAIAATSSTSWFDSATASELVGAPLPVVTTKVVDADADTSIAGSVPSWSGDSGQLYCAASDPSQTLLYFNLADDVTGPATVTSAVLYLTSTDGNGTDGPFPAHEILPGMKWTGGGFTWSAAGNGLQTNDSELSAASLDTSTVTAVIPGVGGSSDRKMWNITSLVQKWVNDPASNNGVAILPPGGHREIFCSSEHPGESVRPKLVIEWSAP